MIRKRQRFAFLAIGGLGLLAAIAPGLAAGIAPPEDRPAAGQGTVLIEGFSVSNIDWEIDDDGNIIEVSFEIERTGARSGVTSAEEEDSGNAVVRVRLEAESGTPPEWVSCEKVNVDARAVCDTEAEADTMLASDLATVNIIAFDRTTS
jgi:hypothetical protein